MRRTPWTAAIAAIASVAGGCVFSDEEEPVFWTTATVIETPEHGPRIAFELALSYPPKGGALPMSNWNWRDAPALESASGTTWGGDYHLVGTWNGEEFTLTEPPRPPTARPFERDFGTPTPGCNEDDLFPVFEFIESLDRESLGIAGGGSDAWDGRCGATVVGYFDTPELRRAIEPMADRIRLFFHFVPVDERRSDD